MEVHKALQTLSEVNMCYMLNYVRNYIYKIYTKNAQTHLWGHMITNKQYWVTC